MDKGEKADRGIPGSAGFSGSPLDPRDRHRIPDTKYHENRKDRTVTLGIHESTFSLE
jgi:hypothetical protein